MVHGLFSDCGAWAPESTGSLVAAHGLSSCGVRAPECVRLLVSACGLSYPVACGILVP